MKKSNEILDKTPMAQSMREMISWASLKIKYFFARDNVKRMRRQSLIERKYLQNTDLIKDCYPKYTKT